MASANVNKTDEKGPAPKAPAKPRTKVDPSDTQTAPTPTPAPEVLDSGQERVGPGFVITKR